MIALFATNSRYVASNVVLALTGDIRYKREAYRSSEFAPRILAEHGLKVLMKVCCLI